MLSARRAWQWGRSARRCSGRAAVRVPPLRSIHPFGASLFLSAVMLGTRSLTAADFLTAPEALDADEKPNENDKTVVKQLCDQLREEVKELDRTAWLYENPDPQAIKV